MGPPRAAWTARQSRKATAVPSRGAAEKARFSGLFGPVGDRVTAFWLYFQCTAGQQRMSRPGFAGGRPSRCGDTMAGIDGSAEIAKRGWSSHETSGEFSPGGTPRAGLGFAAVPPRLPALDGAGRPAGLPGKRRSGGAAALSPRGGGGLLELRRGRQQQPAAGGSRWRRPSRPSGRRAGRAAAVFHGQRAFRSRVRRSFGGGESAGRGERRATRAAGIGRSRRGWRPRRRGRRNQRVPALFPQYRLGLGAGFRGDDRGGRKSVRRPSGRYLQPSHFRRPRWRRRPRRAGWRGLRPHPVLAQQRLERGAGLRDRAAVRQSAERHRRGLLGQPGARRSRRRRRSRRLVRELRGDDRLSPEYRLGHGAGVRGRRDREPFRGDPISGWPACRSWWTSTAISTSTRRSARRTAAFSSIRISAARPRRR